MRMGDAVQGSPLRLGLCLRKLPGQPLDPDGIRVYLQWPSPQHCEWPFWYPGVWVLCVSIWLRNWGRKQSGGSRKPFSSWSVLPDILLSLLQACLAPSQSGDATPAFSSFFVSSYYPTTHALTEGFGVLCFEGLSSRLEGKRLLKAWNRERWLVCWVRGMALGCVWL